MDYFVDLTTHNEQMSERGKKGAEARWGNGEEGNEDNA
jgi:hypothetical protein